MMTETENRRLDAVGVEKGRPRGDLPNESLLAENKSTRLDAVRLEIDRARDDLINEKEQLMAARLELERQISELEAELRMLDSLDRASASGAQPAHSGGVHNRPLNQRVIEILQHNGSQLTSRQIRELLNLDYRESRNLGPVLNQLAKLGKISNEGRGAPWKLIQRRSRSTA
jgi:hypothetical protein